MAEGNEVPSFEESKMFATGGVGVSQAKILESLKRERKKVEEDAQMLANRIALLKQEEIKAMKKIQETKTKAMQIYKVKKENELQTQLKQAARTQMDMKIKDLQINSKDDREKMRQEKALIREEIVKKKHGIYLKIKEESAKISIKKHAWQEQIEENKRAKRQNLKDGLRTSSTQVRKVQSDRLLLTKIDHQRRLQEEELLRDNKEHELYGMEQLEAELIKKMQKVQEDQKQAYDELEDALRMDPYDYAKKFGLKIPREFLQGLKEEAMLKEREERQGKVARQAEQEQQSAERQDSEEVQKNFNKEDDPMD